MPWSYCNKCGMEIDGVKEEFKGCKHCGNKNIIVDDPDLNALIDALFVEIDIIKEAIEQLKEGKE